MAQKAQSKLMAKYGKKLNEAVVAHREDETDFGFQRLPGGIQNGVARLRKCYFKEYDEGTNQKKALDNGTQVSAKGEYYFRAEGTVLDPETNDAGVPVRGLITSVMIPVCQTKKGDGTLVTQEERVEEILNEMRKLGGDEFTQGCTGEDLERLAEDLQTAKPLFKFGSSLSKPQIDPATKLPKVDPKTGEPYAPRVWENWYGAKGLENYTPPDESESAVSDETAGTAQEASESVEETSEATETAAEPSGDAETMVGLLMGLAEIADAEEKSTARKNARLKLQKIADEAGVPLKEVTDADDFAAVVELILAARDASVVNAAAEAGAAAEEETTEEETTEETTEEEPDLAAKYAVGENFKYKPKDKETGKPGKKAVDVEITATDTEKKVVTIKNLIDNRTSYKNVPWTSLIDLE